MSENALWKYLRDGMAAAWEAQRHEDKLSTGGIPDVSYSTNHHGWIELKFVAEPPKRASTPLRIPHYTAEQRNWLERHGKRTGRCYLFVQVGPEYLLFDWAGAQQVGRVPMDELRGLAVARWVNRVDFHGLRQILA